LVDSLATDLSLAVTPYLHLTKHWNKTSHNINRKDGGGAGVDTLECSLRTSTERKHVHTYGKGNGKKAWSLLLNCACI